ncbi:hypothetical protein Tco_1527216 [Tanacetum coccineum]
MTTRSAGRATTAPREGRTGGRTVEEVVELEVDLVIRVMVGLMIKVVNINSCEDLFPTEFLACNPKEYDGKGGVIVCTRWIEKMESVQDMSGYEENQKVKYTAGSFVD